MTKFVGRRGSLGLALNATRTAKTSPTYWLPYVTMSFFDRASVQREEQGMGNIADSDSVYVTMRMGEGEIESQLYDNAMGYILASLLGAAPSSSGANPYTHTYTLNATNTAPTLSLYWKDPDRSLMFPMAVVDSLEMSVEPNGIISYTVGFKSKASLDWASQTPDYTTLGSKFLHQHAQVKLASTIGGLSGATAISLKELTLTINRNTVFDEVIGTVEPEDVLSQALSIEGSLNLNHEDDTYKDYMMDNTYRAMEILLNRSSSSRLTLQFPRVDFFDWEPDYTLNEIATQGINFKASYDSANAQAIITTATLINSKASY